MSSNEVRLLVSAPVIPPPSGQIVRPVKEPPYPHIFYPPVRNGFNFTADPTPPCGSYQSVGERWIIPI
ncbi:hypothetical protein HDV05_006015, partial [Chytridiales sp. JEL 0842]